MDLRELREAAGKTQEELADVLEKAQSEISRIEGRSDYRLSTLQRYVAASAASLKSSRALEIVESGSVQRDPYAI